jgi:hypothetical protein
LRHPDGLAGRHDPVRTRSKEMKLGKMALRLGLIVGVAGLLSACHIHSAHHVYGGGYGYGYKHGHHGHGHGGHHHKKRHHHY